MAMVDSLALEEKQREANDLPEDEAREMQETIQAAWVIRSMELHESFSVADYLKRIEEEGGDALEIEKATAPMVLNLCERWAEAIRAFLRRQKDPGEQR